MFEYLDSSKNLILNFQIWKTVFRLKQLIFCYFTCLNSFFINSIFYHFLSSDKLIINYLIYFSNMEFFNYLYFYFFYLFKLNFIYIDQFFNLKTHLNFIESNYIHFALFNQTNHYSSKF